MNAMSRGVFHSTIDMTDDEYVDDYNGLDYE